MFEHNTIQISQIANGWLVTMPYVPEAYAVPTVMGVPEEDIRKAMRIQLEESQRDPLLGNLQRDKEPDVEAQFEAMLQRQAPPKLIDLKNKQQHFFHNFNDALKFIASQLGNGDGVEFYAMAE